MSTSDSPESGMEFGDAEGGVTGIGVVAEAWVTPLFWSEAVGPDCVSLLDCAVVTSVFTPDVATADVATADVATAESCAGGLGVAAGGALSAAVFGFGRSARSGFLPLACASSFCRSLGRVTR